ncbi:phosphatidate cytidylyltransferase [Chitinophaga sp. NPDC101104]|uniref:phosphatidate cytidylyltransferase n=1 Tax=Chitinophaga sp. NPDC101104 TaxID=3390561 RepID=UPI003D03DAD0
MNRILSLSIIAFLSITLSSCEIVGGIFKAGVWTGLILVALVLGLIIFLFSRGGRKD